MPNTYSKLHAQIIFAVKGRSNFIQNEWRDEFYKYISGIVDGKSQKLYSIGGFRVMPRLWRSFSYRSLITPR